MQLSLVSSLCLVLWSRIATARAGISTSCTSEVWSVPTPWPESTVTIPPVTATDYVTVVSGTTEVQTEVETEVETQVMTDVEKYTQTVTVATTAPITLTITVTTSLDITLCETRIANPTFIAPTPYPTEYTFGCPPGQVCIPPQIGCNFERGVPTYGYYCEPSQCVPAPPLIQQADWGDQSPLTNASLRFDITNGYFNMNPLDYNLPYNIFYEEIISVYTTTVYPPTPTNRRKNRQSQTYIPAVCYNQCNDAMLEAQMSGKTPSLCLPGSAFEVTINYCEACIIAHKASDSSNFIQIQPQFQQFIDYCAKISVSTATEAPGMTTETYESLSTSVVGTSNVVYPVVTTAVVSVGGSSVTPSPGKSAASIASVSASKISSAASEASTVASAGSTADSTAASAASSVASQASSAASVASSSAASESSSAAGESVSTATTPASAPVTAISPPTTPNAITSASSSVSFTTVPPSGSISVVESSLPVAQSTYTSSEAASGTNSGPLATISAYTGEAQAFQSPSKTALWLSPLALAVVMLGNIMYL